MEDPDPNSASAQTERKLAQADREDSGRGLQFVWLGGEIGFQHLGLQTFEANGLVDADVVKTNQTGVLYGGGLGLRLVFLTAGVRFRLGDFPDWQLWTLNAELGIRIPLGALEPYFTLGGGYASLGAFKASGPTATGGDVEITGYDVRAGFGLDLYLSDAFSVGANLTGEVLGLSRPGVTVQGATRDVYAADGSSVGSAVTGTAVLGLHF